MYIEYLPIPLLNDIVSKRCLPFIGSGFSLNAIIPEGEKMKQWDDLGRAFASDIKDYEYSNALDAISAYEDLYKRSTLVSKLRKELLVDYIKIGDTHRSFCTLPFDKVCTTNFDFLLEEGYKSVNKHTMKLSRSLDNFIERRIRRTGIDCVNILCKVLSEKTSQQ